MLVKGTLQTLLDHVEAKSNVALNVLDLPLGKSTVPIPPMFQDIASDAYSIPYVQDLMNVTDLRDILSWGTAATQKALSWFHVDDDGFATAVYVLSGGKWWVLAERVQDDRLHEEMGDTGAFNKWEVRDIDGQRWNLEAIYLHPGSVLYVQLPAT